MSLASTNTATIKCVPGRVYAQVILRAGYQQNFDQLFQGYVYQLRSDKESSVDTFLGIFAADGDMAGTSVPSPPQTSDVVATPT